MANIKRISLKKAELPSGSPWQMQGLVAQVQSKSKRTRLLFRGAFALEALCWRWGMGDTLCCTPGVGVPSFDEVWFVLLGFTMSSEP